MAQPSTLPADLALRALAHELVPLITTQRGVLRRVAHGPRPAQGSEDLHLALELADDLGRVVDLLTGPARTGHGGPARTGHGGAVPARVAEVVAGLRRRRPGVGVRCSRGAGRCVLAPADAGRLATVLDNLVRNEQQHGGGGRTEVLLRRRRRRLVVMVLHPGSRPAAVHAALHSAPDAGGPSGTGPHGLGLWLVRHLVGQVGGSASLRGAGRRWAVHVVVPIRSGAVRAVRPRRLSRAR